jgi:DNA-3-methyladenine glycosylase II
MNMASSEKEIHRLFIDIASELSPALSDGIARVGPVPFQPDNSLPLAHRLCRSVAGQQLSVKAARSIWERVLTASGGVPLTEFIREQNTELLRSCGLSAAKVRSMCGIAEEARAGGLEAEELGQIGHQERSRHLIKLWGGGQWTADMISIFYFGDEDVWPDGDLVARSTLEKLTSRRRKTIRTAERFSPHRSRLALYMWKYNDVEPV